MSKFIALNSYFNWVCSIAIDDSAKRQSYYLLLRGLWDTPFVYSIELDKNREIDGRNLRYTFGDMHGYSIEEVEDYLDDRPCSVLEMMVALACRCEEQIMQNPLGDNKTSFWFMEMIKTLRLLPMVDSRFDYMYFDECMTTFLNRLYLPNGYGGLFKVDNPRRDMRDTEIWYQCMWYLESYLEKQSFSEEENL